MIDNQVEYVANTFVIRCFQRLSSQDSVGSHFSVEFIFHRTHDSMYPRSEFLEDKRPT